MKKIILALSMGLIILVQGCQTTSPTPQEVIQDALPFIPTATSLACGVVLQFAVDNPADKKLIANYIYSIATGVRSLMMGNPPSPDQLKQTISLFAPDQAHWADFSTSISSLYAGYYPQIKGDPKLAMDVLEAIAEGCERATAQLK